MDDPGGQPFGLAPITLADKSLFDKAFASLKQPTTDYSFANTFIWGSSLKLYWTALAGHLCVFANGTGDLTMLLPPIPLSAEAGASDGDLRSCLERCFEIMDTYNRRIGAETTRSRIEYVSDELLERLNAVVGGGSAGLALSLSASPMSGDYVYDMARMVDLAGGSLKSKRHARSKFIRDFPHHRTEDLADHHVPACLDLLRLWSHHGDDTHEGEVSEAHVGSDILRHKDTLACELALSSWRELGLRGMVLLVDAPGSATKLVGFTLGEALSPAQASILIEKTRPDCPGSAQFIFSEFCRLYWPGFTECNAGDDWGIPSLRFTKQSYRPTRLLSKYTLTRQAPVVVGPPAIEVPARGATQELVLPIEAEAQLAAALSRSATLARATPCVTLRQATADDAGAVLDLERACFASLDEVFNKRQVKYLIASKSAAVTVAEEDGRIVGWSVGLVRQHRRSRTGRLYALAVHPEARARNLALQLAEHTLDALATLGLDRVYAEVRDASETTIALYRQLGFTDHQFLPNYHGSGDHGRRMRLALDAGATLFVSANETVGAAV